MERLYFRNIEKVIFVCMYVPPKHDYYLFIFFKYRITVSVRERKSDIKLLYYMLWYFHVRPDVKEIIIENIFLKKKL